MQLTHLKTVELQKFFSLIFSKKTFQFSQILMILKNLSNNDTLTKELFVNYSRLRNYKTIVSLELNFIFIVIDFFSFFIVMLNNESLSFTFLNVMNFAAEKNQHDMRILNINIVLERIRNSKKIFSLLNEKCKDVSHQIANTIDDDLIDLFHYNVVYVISLIKNNDENKIEVLRNIATRMRKKRFS